MLERRHVLGGAAVTEEVFPGFQFSVCSYVVSLLRPEIIRELDLPRHGLEILPLDGTFTPMPNGDYLWRMSDHARTRREIYRHSPAGRRGLRRVREGDGGHGALRQADPVHGPARPLLATTCAASAGSLGMGRRFQELPRATSTTCVQLMTMSAADLLDQWFETDVLKATMSASGIIGTFLGVRSPGTAYVLLHHYMGEIDGAFRSWGFSRGRHRRHQHGHRGRGARRRASRSAPRPPIERIKVKDGRADGRGAGERRGDRRPRSWSRASTRTARS